MGRDRLLALLLVVAMVVTSVIALVAVVHLNGSHSPAGSPSGPTNAVVSGTTCNPSGSTTIADDTTWSNGTVYCGGDLFIGSVATPVSIRWDHVVVWINGTLEIGNQSSSQQVVFTVENSTIHHNRMASYLVLGESGQAGHVWKMYDSLVVGSWSLYQGSYGIALLSQAPYLNKLDWYNVTLQDLGVPMYVGAGKVTFALSTRPTWLSSSSAFAVFTADTRVRRINVTAAVDSSDNYQEFAGGVYLGNSLPVAGWTFYGGHTSVFDTVIVRNSVFYQACRAIYLDTYGFTGDPDVAFNRIYVRSPDVCKNIDLWKPNTRFHNNYVQNSVGPTIDERSLPLKNIVIENNTFNVALININGMQEITIRNNTFIGGAPSMASSTYILNRGSNNTIVGNHFDGALGPLSTNVPYGICECNYPGFPGNFNGYIAANVFTNFSRSDSAVIDVQGAYGTRLVNNTVSRSNVLALRIAGGSRDVFVFNGSYSGGQMGLYLQGSLGDTRFVDVAMQGGVQYGDAYATYRVFHWLGLRVSVPLSSVQLADGAGFSQNVVADPTYSGAMAHDYTNASAGYYRAYATRFNISGFAPGSVNVINLSGSAPLTVSADSNGVLAFQTPVVVPHSFLAVGPNSAPPVPYLHPLANGAYVSVRLQWDAVSDPDGDPVTYDLRIGTSPGASDVVAISQGANVSEPFTTSDGVTYYWAVRARDPFIASDWSAESAFTDLGEPPPSSSAPPVPILEPVPDADYAQATLAWSVPSNNTVSNLAFQVRVGTSPAASDVLLQETDKLSITIWTQDGVRYYWSVRSQRNGTYSAWASQASFVDNGSGSSIPPPTESWPDFLAAPSPLLTILVGVAVCGSLAFAMRYGARWRRLARRDEGRATEKVVYQCPNCETIVGEDDEVCAGCGALFGP